MFITDWLDVTLYITFLVLQRAWWMEHSFVLFNIVLAACLAFGFATVTQYISSKYLISETEGIQRFDTLDGLRGLAAMLVAIHHSFFFYWYAKTGNWSIDYIGGGHLQVFVDYLGKGSVSIFFMITAFLFWGKILCKAEKVDWIGFYIKRFFRIVPLYVVVVFAALLYVLINIKSKFELFPYVRDTFYWLTFDFFGTPNINGFPLSKSIVAGVFWTLSFEWMFYFMLPALSVFAVNKKSSAFIVCMMFVISAFIFSFNIGIRFWTQIHVLCFIIGVACAHLYKFHYGIIKKLKSPIFAVIAIASLCVCVYIFDVPYSHVPTILIGIAFLIISCGNSVFGILHLRVMKMLGAISFSVYLLHGLTYTVIFSPMIKSGVSYQAAISITIPSIIALSTVSYLFIERKFISKGKAITEKTTASAM